MEERVTPRTGLRYVLHYLSDSPVLVIGPGINLSGESRYLKQHIVAIDIDIKALELSRDKAKLLIRADINQGIPIKEGAFLNVFMGHVLEHTDSPINVLRQINSIIKESGILILGLPHEGALVEWFHPYFKNHPDHLYSFSLNGIRRLLDLTGFRILSFYFDTPYRFGPFLKIISYLSKILPKQLICLFSPSYWVVAKKEFKTSYPNKNKFY